MSSKPHIMPPLVFVKASTGRAVYVNGILVNEAERHGAVANQLLVNLLKAGINHDKLEVYEVPDEAWQESHLGGIFPTLLVDFPQGSLVLKEEHSRNIWARDFLVTELA